MPRPKIYKTEEERKAPHHKAHMKWRAKNIERYREYQREYQRERYKKLRLLYEKNINVNTNVNDLKKFSCSMI